MQNYKDVMSMEVDFDFVTGGQQIKVSILVSLYLIFFFFPFITSGDFFFLFQDNKASLRQATAR